jgi:hypothetical protein
LELIVEVEEGEKDDRAFRGGRDRLF